MLSILPHMRVGEHDYATYLTRKCQFGGLCKAAADPGFASRALIFFRPMRIQNCVTPGKFDIVRARSPIDTTDVRRPCRLPAVPSISFAHSMSSSTSRMTRCTVGDNASCRPGGTVLISTPLHSSRWTRMWWLNHHRERAMRLYSRTPTPLGLRFQKALQLVPGIIATDEVDEILLVCRWETSGVVHRIML
jgi:hypothetical protein